MILYQIQIEMTFFFSYKRKIQDLLVDEDDRAAKLARLDTMPQH